MTERLGNLAKQVLSERQSKPNVCECCHKRPKRREFGQQKEWCKVCITKAERSRWPEGALEAKVVRLTDPLYAAARLQDLSAGLQKKIEQLPDDKGLMLWGKQGVGKSHAMAAVMRHYFLEGFDVVQVGYEMLCLEIRDTFKAGSTKGEIDVIKPLVAADKLFIEDVGTTVSIGQQESDFSLRTFLVILDERLRNCSPTYITTNKSVEELGKSFDARIASRLQQACEIVQLTGEDPQGGQKKLRNFQELSL